MTAEQSDERSAAMDYLKSGIISAAVRHPSNDPVVAYLRHWVSILENPESPTNTVIDGMRIDRLAKKEE